MRQFQLILFVLFSGIFSGFSQHGKSKMTEEEFHEMRYEIEKIQTSNKDSVFVLVDDMMKIANSFKDDQILAKALLTKADVRSKYKDQVQAIATINEAIKINKRQNNKAELALCYYILGKCYAQKADHIEATKYYLKAIETTKEKDSVIIVKAYSGLTMVSVAQANYQNGLKYNLLAEKYTTKSTPEELIAHNLMIKGVIYRFLEDFKKADTYLSKAATLFKKINNKFNLASTLNEQSDLYLESDPLKCIDLKLEAKALLDEIAPERSTTAYCLSILGDLYITVATNDSLLKNIKNPIVPKTKIRLFNDAESFYLRALDITKKNNNIQGVSESILYLSILQGLKGDYKNAYENLVVATKMNDSLFSQENKNAIAKLESEKEVGELKAANEKKETFNAILIGSSIALLLILFFAYRNFRNKRKVQNLKISELEKDKQLLTVDAMLKGQEEERSRIAKDLHDGLGGLLSGTKLSFINMKENLILTPENAEQFDKSLSMLDTTIVDLRKVAQNLMPEALVKFGLNEALRDFCNSIQSSSKITVNCQKIGVNRKLNNTAEVFVYRIIQELTNNAVKHSKATEIIVQLALSETKTSITVEDNGIGYENTNLQNKNGSGLDNIEYRVQYLNGTIDTETGLNKGTSVNIELNV
ncbi:histidine kinase [Aequorivita sublithincola DSM 14238]|uniref:histidine kinase n=2 Tax=Aequorivita TaxID=153265 RepID=I3YWA5_AEQSU|nr:histidine kinase [Aequorivita sublithincola DSM 14238]